MSHAGKYAPLQSKLMKSAMKHVNIEMFRHVEEEAKEETARGATENARKEVAKTAKRQCPTRTLGKSISFLVRREEKLAPH